MSNSPYIANVNQHNFQSEVIERSMKTPVLVDFWAGWCNPCKMLMPMLAAVVEECEGEIFLAKVDTDTERTLAEQFGIRSLPTVKLFKQGEIVDEFMGVIPESAIREFINKHKFNPLDFELQTAEDAFQNKNYDEATQIVEQVLAKDNTNTRAIILASRIALQTNAFAKVDELMSHLPINAMDDPEVKEISALKSFAAEVAAAPDYEELQESLLVNDTVEGRYQLGCYHALKSNYESALENFLKVMEKDRQFKEDGARRNILAIFDLLGGSGPLVNVYRVKMSRLLH